ncbi:hypothetical protein [Nostoc sp. FACHB-110]|uniref:hypothetical protein n=1 Tax=Nostoc sp. FACHB-110 TaxID=2692834 RepID=UPI0016826824|nr:hypothetical protein [Nostoc sp. FACHB-110]MBD2439519.1 hypothetical protein [Nostoc sp. FACHB-110]
MHFLINELSFIKQAKHNDDADRLMIVLFEIIKELEPLFSKPILTHSTFFSCYITEEVKVGHWLYQKSKSANGKEQETSRILLIKLMNNGPFIDEILDEELEFHECYFNHQDVCGSSLAGAVYLQGNLISLQDAPDFVSQSIQLRYSHNGVEYQEIEITNLTHVIHTKKLRRFYVPSPKHAPGGWGTLMDLNDEVAQVVLDKGIVNGRQIYGYYGGKFYEFQSDNFAGFHGYPVDENEVPYKVIEYLTQLQTEEDS